MTTQNDSWTDNNSNYSDDITIIDEFELIEKAKRADKGYNKFFRNVFYKNERGQIRKKREKVEFYTTANNNGETLIRDAESGTYYNYKVGSADEDIFFKAIIHSGVCNNKGKTSTAFFLSPHAYMSLMDRELSQDIIDAWQKKRNARMEILRENQNKTIHMSSVVVR